ncbi:MAG TPA: Spy/CpxP family protein refolding chaperone [Polyangiaceae bacterium]|nr:Spy/CpxP family protein refolding chaperone [Polyangiaceae bacterium]
MRSIEWKCGLLAALLTTSGAAAFGCGGEATSSPPPASPAASASAVPVASASAEPAASASAPPAASQVAAPQTAPAETTTKEDEEASAEVVEHHRHHHHAGVGQFVAMSLETLGITPEQHAAIEKIQATLRTKLQPARAADRKLIGLLADGVAAGKIDKAKVDAAIGQLDATSATVHAAAVEALDQLHASLTDAQRMALVDKVKAHWQIWQQANESGASAAEPHEHGRLEELSRDVSLSPDQVDKIRTNLRAAAAKAPDHFEPEKVTARLDTFGSAFESATFDAKTLKAPEVNPHLASWGAKRMAGFYEIVTPVLTPEQRTKLADHLREHANHEEAPAGDSKEGKP